MFAYEGVGLKSIYMLCRAAAFVKGVAMMAGKPLLSWRIACGEQMHCIQRVIAI